MAIIYHIPNKQLRQRGLHPRLQANNRLMFITHETAQHSIPEQVEAVLEGGCGWIQLRMKNGLRDEVAQQVVHLCQQAPHPVDLCIDDQVDFALRHGATAVHVGKFRLQLGGADAVLVGEVGLFIDGVLFLHHIVQVLVAHDDGVQNGVFVVGVLVLLQHGHPLVRVHGDGAAGGVQLPGENPQEGGFAGAVGADDAVAVAGEELEIHILEQPLAAKLHTEIGYCDHFILLIVSFSFFLQMPLGT